MYDLCACGPLFEKLILRKMWRLCAPASWNHKNVEKAYLFTAPAKMRFACIQFLCFFELMCWIVVRFIALALSAVCLFALSLLLSAIHYNLCVRLVLRWEYLCGELAQGLHVLTACAPRSRAYVLHMRTNVRLVHKTYMCLQLIRRLLWWARTTRMKGAGRL